MAVTRREVRVFEVNYQCDTCSKGNMQYTKMCKGDSSSFLSSLYEHKCDNKLCGVTLNLPSIYPKGEAVPRRKRKL